ncbi:2'-5' RNA ligase family protein [Actinopolymorpha pittospori]|uniref:2'-5' RNA ligase family protein n=1 Tax=Actinopolymorpha pittospori TaxID=648752 RepID=A0A927N1T6_9ACTN|nr:hypothetical protein [Actinopolymorpha pittospori]MBE1607090.1 hypothetical protein [Actinopolymorpha pittospori]
MVEGVGIRSSELRARGRAALAAGQVALDTPPEDGGRWGLTALLRPTGAVLASLVDLADRASAVAGPGHWMHGATEVHLTIRTFEPHRRVIGEDDPRLSRYRQALAAAVVGLIPFHLRLRGLSPHPRGVAVLGEPVEETADLLRLRLWEALRSDETADGPPQRDWYANLVHFAAPVSCPADVVAWCDARADLDVGTLRFSDVEVVRWSWDGMRMRATTLDLVSLCAG